MKTRGFSPVANLQRRGVLLALGLGGLSLGLRVRAQPAAGQQIDDTLAELERQAGGRLGVHLLDSASGRELGRRSDQRFGMCSTFKLPLAAAILREADAGRLSLDDYLEYGKKDMVAHAPVTTEHLKEGRMRIGALAEAAQKTSDNVAANLLIAKLGGPQAVTAIFRDMGDSVTRIDRMEPEMNLVIGNEERDTTTPRAMAHLVARLMTGKLLEPASRERLADWMIATTTGLKRIRAGLPADWKAGDKTGTGISEKMPNKHNDVAVIWPPDARPIVVAAYYEADAHYPKMRPEDDAVLAEVGRMGAAWIKAA